MEFPEEIKRIRQKCFFTQHDFAKEIQVAFSTVNRWEGGKAKPNLTAMKNIKEFCLRNDIEYASVEEMADKIVKVVDTVEPDPELTARYNARYDQFRQIYPACKELFDIIQ